MYTYRVHCTHNCQLALTMPFTPLMVWRTPPVYLRALVITMHVPTLYCTWLPLHLKFALLEPVNLVQPFDSTAPHTCNTIQYQHLIVCFEKSPTLSAGPTPAFKKHYQLFRTSIDRPYKKMYLLRLILYTFHKYCEFFLMHKVLI